MGTTPGDRGRFDGFDSVAQSRHWDDETRAVVFSRLAPKTPTPFFDPSQQSTAQALLDRLLGQDDEPKVPLLELIAERLANREGDGYRYHDMPVDWDAWKQSVDGLDDDAHRDYGRSFSTITVQDQKNVIETVRTTDGDWHGMPGSRVFQLWMRYAATAFYSHPWAWNEVGFPGPAYPRGYKTLAVDVLEPFETREHDPRDPIPWMQKVDEVRAEHADQTARVHGQPTSGSA
jgi:hypothetical protein